MKRFLVAVAFNLLVLVFPALAQSQEVYPDRPLRIIVPSPVGGPNDALARVLGQKLGERWNQPVVIDNRAGASGSIAAAFVAKSAPDGYVLLVTTAGVVTVNPSLSPVNFDTMKDLAPVALTSTLASVLVVPASLGVKTTRQLIDLAKSQPGKLNYASANIGSTSHLSMSLFNRAANLQMQHVPYNGAPPAVTALLSGSVQVMLIGLTSVLPHINSGKLVALGVSSLKPSPLAPGVPTIAATLPGFEVSNWLGVFAPAGTPPAIVNKLNAAINDIMAQPDTWALLSKDGFEPVPANTPAQFGKYVGSEITKWSKVVKDVGITSN